MIDIVEEQVLCSPVSSLPDHWLPKSGSIPISKSDLLEGLAGLSPVWLSRSRAELNPEYLQWISYGLVRNVQGQFAAYRRKGSESRLQGLSSLGIGGHINSIDQGTASLTKKRSLWTQLFWNGFRRELTEELPGALQGCTRFLGLVYESLSPVGRVHIGLVFLHDSLEAPASGAPELGDFTWLSIPGTSSKAQSFIDPAWQLDTFELWSRLALQLIPKL
jgi:predicted NUDIX family phosphoesterase